MNIFVIDGNPTVAAEMACDKHIVKMVTESAQMLSTAHRILDGTLELEETEGGRMKKYWRLPHSGENVFYRVTHHNHPCNVWIRENSANYMWLWEHYNALCSEFQRRYGHRDHKGITRLDPVREGRVAILPGALKRSNQRTPFVLGFNKEKYPDCEVPGDPITSYRNFYIASKSHFARWDHGPVPEWWPYPQEEK